MTSSPSEPSQNSWAGRFTLICLASLLPVWLTAVFGPQSGMEAMIILLPLMVTIGTHFTLGLCALYLAWREPGPVQRFLVTGYFAIFFSACLLIWADYNEVPTYLRTVWRDFTSPQDKQLIDSIRKRESAPQVAQQALDAGAEVDGATPEQSTPLVEAVRYQKTEIVKVLLEGGADPNRSTADGAMPLALAVSNLNNEIISALLEAGADPNQRIGRQTPLCQILAGSASAQLPARKHKVVQILVRAGADADRYCDAKETSTGFQIAARYRMRETIAMLTGAGQRVERNKGHKDFGGALYRAVQLDQSDWLQQLLKAGVDPDAPTRSDMTAMEMAIKLGNADQVRLLLEHGADPTIRPYVDQVTRLSGDRSDLLRLLLKAGARVDTPVAGKPGALQRAISWGRTGQVEILLQSGADSDFKNANNEPLLVTLQRGRFSAQRRQLIELLIEYGANLNIRDPEGRTPLMVAMQQGHFQLAERLITHGADLDAMDDSGRTAVHHAILHPEPAPILARLKDLGANFSRRDRQGQSAACYALAKANYSAFKALLVLERQSIECGDQMDRSLIEVTEQRKADAVATLLQYGANPNLESGRSMSLLEIAARRNFLDGFKVLLGHKADPNTRVRSGNPLLPYIEIGAFPWQYPGRKRSARIPLPILTAALLGGYQAVIGPLLEAGADPNLRDQKGNTPLLALAAAEPGTTDVYPLVGELIVAGADPHAPNTEGYSVPTLAADRDRLQLLLTLAAAGVDLNRADDRGRTVMTLLAAHTHQMEKTRQLIGLGLKVSTDAMQIAKSRKHKGLIRILQQAY